VRYTVLALLSSPRADDNFFSRLIGYDDPNDPSKKLMDTFHLTNACAECIKKDSSLWKFCTHTNRIEPSFKSRESSDKWTIVMKLENKLANLLREEYAVITNSYVPCFNKKQIERFVTKNNWVRPHLQTSENSDRIGAIFCAIDPNNGGKDETAIVIGYLDMHYDLYVVC